MCGICGCEQTLIQHDTYNTQAETRLVAIEEDLLAKNDHFAALNRHSFAEQHVRAFNLISSPGSGKTSLLVKTLSDLKEAFSFAVIEGDQQSDLDARRVAATGAPVKQINTGKMCHLDAHMVGHALETLPQQRHSILFIENVGNLVCPTLFDLGESARIVLLSVTEGDDKPMKYPYIFETADLVILNKIDLLPYVDFDLDRCITSTRHINSKVEFITASVKIQDGLDDWYSWLERVSA